MQEGQFKCEICQKICKTKGGLTRHQKKSHPLAIDGAVISQSDIRKIVEEAKEIVSSDECYPKELTSELHGAASIMEEFILKARELYAALQKSPDLDKYYSTFMDMLPLNAVKFFPHLTQPAAVLHPLVMTPLALENTAGKLPKVQIFGGDHKNHDGEE